MRELLVGALLVVAAAALAEDNPEPQLCPQYCTCSQRGFNGVIARCYLLDKDNQKFSPEISHLVVENVDLYSDGFSLHDRIFKDLGLTHVQTIKISNSSLRSVDRYAFEGLHELYHVDLSENKLMLIHPDTFQGNDQLRHLCLSGNPLQLTQLLPSAGQYFLFSEPLTELVLSRCQLRQLSPGTFSHLKNLEVLDLSHNYLQSLNKSMFTGLDFLDEINLSHNEIATLAPDTFSEMEEMSSLILRGNPLRTLEDVALPDLMELDVSHCGLTSLTATMLEGAPELSHLNLSHNSIDRVDKDAFSALTGLKYLDLSHNRLKGPLSSYLFEYNDDLETLSLAGNKNLNRFSGFKGRFDSLYLLDLSRSGICELSNESFVGMHYITTLNMSGNCLSQIGRDTFSGMRHLMILDLSNNKLHYLKSNMFSSNTDLRKLYLGGNHLSHFPVMLLSSTPKLYYLDLSHNQLNALWNVTESVIMKQKGILSKLTFLNLAGNKIKKLFLHHFIITEKLQTLDISGNPMECSSSFNHLVEWLTVHRVVPNKAKTENPLPLDPSAEITNRLQWDGVLMSVCPNPTEPPSSPPAIFPKLPHPLPDEPKPAKILQTDIVIERVSSNESPQDSFITAFTFFLFSVGFIILLLSLTLTFMYFCRRSRIQARGFTPLDGHFPVRHGGRNVYQKLYKDCSVPNKPIVKGGARRLSIVSVFSEDYAKKAPIDDV